jgi:hypothetical protein
MNSGKTHSFFLWASQNAWVPPVYLPSSSVPLFSYSNATSNPPHLAPHDSSYAWNDRTSGKMKPWRRPDFVVKVDDDSFVMLAELEGRLRLELHQSNSPSSSFVNFSSSASETSNLSDYRSSTSTTRSPVSMQPVAMVSTLPAADPLVYWGYLVKNRFMAGELYGLSWSLVEWVANDPVVKGLIKGAEDKQTARWMKLHPRASEVRWTNERCWIYDHPRSGTV